MINNLFPKTFQADRVGRPVISGINIKSDVISILSKTMMHSLIRANKDALFVKYLNREPGTIIPTKAGIQSLQLRKNRWMPTFAGMTRY